MAILTPEQVIASYPWTLWKKTAVTRIKKILTQADIQAEPEPFFFDLEGRKHEVKIGRCICIGIENERWTCSVESLERDRYPVSDEDKHGYREYRMKNVHAVRCFDIPFAFTLIVPNESSWNCPDVVGGIIAWNGEMEDQLDMRVIKRAIFEKTYEHQ